MTTSPRTNDEWLQQLNRPGHEQGDALVDLYGILVRGLGHAMIKYPKVTRLDAPEFAYEALLKILATLDSFQGENRFTTWALKIAVHTAFAELRLRRPRDVSLEEVTVPTDTPVDRPAGTEHPVAQSEVLGVMRSVIMEELTDRQREALVAVRFHGMPMAQVAARMGFAPNALHELLSDTRKRLKSRMLARGLSRDDITAVLNL